MTIQTKFRCMTFMLCLCAALTACSPARTYRNDYTAAQLMNDLAEAVPSEAGYRAVERDYLASNLGDDAKLIEQHVTDWDVRVSDRSDAHPDQIMILHVNDASDQLPAVTDAVHRYGEILQTRSRDYFRMYAPEEVSKLDNLSVKVCGNYILLTVLNEQQTAKAHAAFERALVS